MIARAIILGPELLVADEPVSMLDMSVRAKILELMLDLRRDLNLTYLYITHDLATAKFFCDRVAIMYLGRIVEIGSVEQIYADPRHPYTRALLSAIPEPDPTKSIPRDVPRGEIPDAARRPMGCSFHPRCPRAFEVCGWESRDLRNLLELRWVEAGEQAYEQEQAMVANLAELEEPSTDVMLQPARGHDAAEILALLQQIRSEHPEEPLWRGVRELTRDGNGVRVRFWDGVDPGLFDADGVLAACLLHDPESRRRAEELSAQARLERPGRAGTR